jgi:hypothetical protein
MPAGGGSGISAPPQGSNSTASTQTPSQCKNTQNCLKLTTASRYVNWYTFQGGASGRATADANYTDKNNATVSATIQSGHCVPSVHNQKGYGSIHLEDSVNEDCSVRVTDNLGQSVNWTVLASTVVITCPAQWTSTSPSYQATCSWTDTSATATISLHGVESPSAHCGATIVGANTGGSGSISVQDDTDEFCRPGIIDSVGSYSVGEILAI